MSDTPTAADLSASLTLAEICRMGGFRAAWVIELVEYGALEPGGGHEAEWRFPPADAAAAIRAWRLSRDLGVNAAGAALALSLLRERDELRRRLAAYAAFTD